MKIAVLVSGGGTNLQALIDAWHEDRLGGGELSLVVSSKKGVFALDRAQKAGIKTVTIERKLTAEQKDFDSAVLTALSENNIDLIVLAGFLSALGDAVTEKYKNKIINVHPALIPSFCGKGFYGIHVHKAVLEYGVKITGATVHFVNEIIDGGKIILQKAIDVLPSDTPQSLQQRVMQECEWVLLPKAVEMICRNEII
ncbi:MAG: phosphoribosylglycinamide formyltransferase [Treponema sp.]|nr:phosphoribosylglycinamide formyltransferase [Treponema sp.]